MTEMQFGSEYEITYKTFVFNRKEIVHTSNYWKDEDIDSTKESKFHKNHLSTWGIDCKNIISIHYLRPRSKKAFSMVTKFYRLRLTNGKELRVIEILDMIVQPKYRSKNVGSQALNILESIGKKNKCDLIVGELQDDEYLERRKNFFAKNGFELTHSPKVKFSGWACRKNISTTR